MYYTCQLGPAVEKCSSKLTCFFAARVFNLWWKWRLLIVQNPTLLSRLAQMVQSSFMIIKVSRSFWHLSFRENEKESFLLLFFDFISAELKRPRPTFWFDQKRWCIMTWEQKVFLLFFIKYIIFLLLENRFERRKIKKYKSVLGSRTMFN